MSRTDSVDCPGEIECRDRAGAATREVRRSVDSLRDPQQRVRRRSSAKLTEREMRAAIEHRDGDPAFVADASVAVSWVDRARVMRDRRKPPTERGPSRRSTRRLRSRSDRQSNALS
jgi:hypothetical protein